MFKSKIVSLEEATEIYGVARYYILPRSSYILYLVEKSGLKAFDSIEIETTIKEYNKHVIYGDGCEKDYERFIEELAYIFAEAIDKLEYLMATTTRFERKMDKTIKDKISNLKSFCDHIQSITEEDFFNLLKEKFPKNHLDGNEEIELKVPDVDFTKLEVYSTTTNGLEAVLEGEPLLKTDEYKYEYIRSEPDEGKIELSVILHKGEKGVPKNRVVVRFEYNEEQDCWEFKPSNNKTMVMFLTREENEDYIRKLRNNLIDKKELFMV
jgi:hypothetical protein